MKNTDLTGQQFGKWIVLRQDEERSGADTSYWICKCECGTERSVAASNLRRGKSASCGCRNNLKAMIGEKYGKWRVTGVAEEKKPWGKTFVVCVCECGAQKEIEPHKLRHGKTRSCGCGRSGKNTEAGATPIMLTFAHKTATLAEWAIITGIGYATLLSRHRMGWAVENILFMPVRSIPKKLASETVDQKEDHDESPMDAQTTAIE